MDPQAKKKWVRSAGLALGLALVVAMIGASLFSSAGHADWSRLAHAQAWQIALLLGGVVAQLLLSGLLFWVVTLSFDAKPRVALGEMMSVITLSAAANYLPMTGAVGRAAYLKLRHGLPVRQSVIIQLIVVALSVAVSLVVALAAAAALVMEWNRPAVGSAAAFVFAGLALATGTAASRALKRSVVAGWAWVLVRLAELLVSSVRLWAAFAIMGFDASIPQVIACSAAGFFVSLTGLTPNGLGMREWAVAAVAHMVTPEIGAAAAAAPLVDRAAEVIVFAIGAAVSAKKLGWDELRIVFASPPRE